MWYSTVQEESTCFYCKCTLSFLHGCIYCTFRFADLFLERVTHIVSGNYSCTVTVGDNVAMGYGILTVACKFKNAIFCCTCT